MPTIFSPSQPAFDIFHGNYIQLIAFLKSIEDYPNSFDFWINRDEHWIQSIRESARLLYNFTTSAVSVVEQTKHVFNELPKVKELSLLVSEYNAEIKRRFEVNGDHRIIHGLRVHLVHYNIVNIGSVYHWDREEGFDHKLVIQAAQLLASKYGFDKIACRRLKNVGKDISVRTLANDCYTNINEFNKWLEQKQGQLLNDRRFCIFV